MAEKHKEKTFEEEVVAELCARGWVEGKATGYDRQLGLYSEDVIEWIKQTQPKVWDKIKADRNGQAEASVLTRLADCLEKEGALSVLRHGFKDVGAKFDMCQFKPSHELNPDILEKHHKVILRVVRQVKYSTNHNNDNSIDLVFFVNGIPVATWELKTDFTQSIDDAVKQYRDDRPPRDPQTNKDEPLLKFKRGALVHFAVSTAEVQMATRLASKSTYFLPFNLGHDEGAGNPPNPKGYRVSYLWERVFERSALLDILGRFVHLATDEKIDDRGKKYNVETMIFPRFHQWEAVTSLIDAATQEGAGNRYLIQHSAGSGKSNSIAWLSHQLSSLHAGNEKVFDSVIVITDRTVLDAQLQDTIYQFEHKHGVVCKIEDKAGAKPKSEQLADALRANTPIIICTLQTFPFAMEAIAKDASAKGKKFAIIADEAHSSQSGGAANKLKAVLTSDLEAVLTPERIKEIEDGDDISAEEVMLVSMHGRSQAKNLSYFAFTATPKAKTLEIFGRRPKPTEAAGPDNLPEPFHLYSMQQAIEEGFILDVLKNFVTYKMAFRLAHSGKDYSDADVEKSSALKSLMRWVRLHPYNIAQKIEVVVEHFRANVQWRLEGQAKAMVVVASRKEAVRWKLALDAYLKKKGYKDLAALVAFSGDVADPESGFDAVSERSEKLNAGLKGRDIRDAFATESFQILIVANKFQVGFDQPKLVSMYVDKKLSGVTAVQTLSRLNRTFKGKTDTFVLDFVNDEEEILESFKPYFRKAELAGVSDPNIIHDLQTKLDDELIYLSPEVDAFVNTYLDPKGTQAQLQARIAPAVDRFSKRLKAAKAATPKDGAEIDRLTLFRKDLGSFIRAYDFLSQIVNFADTDLEKRSIFYKHLLPVLRIDREQSAIDLSAVLMTHYNLRSKGQAQITLSKEASEDGKLSPLNEIGAGVAKDPSKEKLSEIIQTMNTLFDGELTDADLLNYANHIRDKMLENKTLANQAAANEIDQFGASPDFDKVMMKAVVDAFKSHKSMSEQVLKKDSVKDGLSDLLLSMVYEGFKAQAAAGKSKGAGV
jgi:type I restriction enzyme, R subunit